MKVKIKKTHPDAVIPTYAKPGDAGMDLTAISCLPVFGSDGEVKYLEYNTGLSVEIPVGYVGLVFPRSGISEKGLRLANSVAVIDSGYRGDLKSRFKMDGTSMDIYAPGDRIAQLVILPYPQIEFEEVEKLELSERGEGGFGHTGR